MLLAFIISPFPEHGPISLVMSKLPEITSPQLFTWGTDSEEMERSVKTEASSSKSGIIVAVGVGESISLGDGSKAASSNGIITLVGKGVGEADALTIEFNSMEASITNGEGEIV